MSPSASPSPTPTPTPPPPPPDDPSVDPLTPARLLRRAAIALTGLPPTAADYDALEAAADDAARVSLVDAAVDRYLADPSFYRTMVDFGREWIAMPAIAATADEPEYFAAQQWSLPTCPSGTAHAGELAMYNYYDAGLQPCDGKNEDGSPADVRDVEPWWAPGTMVRVVGRAGDPRINITGPSGPIDCGAHSADEGTPPDHYETCGCGPNLRFCKPGNPADWKIYLTYNPLGQRRLLWEEPARLVGHLAWQDRGLEELIVGSNSVGPVDVQAAYVRSGRAAGATELDTDDQWWKPEQFTGAIDPEHNPGDRNAWREFSQPARNPKLLLDRNYHYDPRTDPPGTMQGLPAAGVLTMIGPLGAFTRERVRGARFLEIFACEAFSPPPASQIFNRYERDPATEGPCQHCHARIDPAAIHFKRWDRIGNAVALVGIGRWQIDNQWTTSQYPYHSDPFARWARLWIHDSRLTPVSAAVAMSNPSSRFIDFLPPEQSLLGQKSDGTVGPLGFGKLLLASGAFDRCLVRRLHERFVGRDIDPATEAGYLQALVDRFVASDRRARPFIKMLTQTASFRRGL
ncbi:MAG: hypothetical protein U1E65_15320 [Myxococcota bacterium]